MKGAGMSFQLRLDEMLCVLEDLKHPRAAEFVRAVERLGDVLIKEICDVLEISPGATTFDMGSIAAPVFPVDAGQELPSAIRHYDSGDEWGPQGSMKL
jgi:hypothetical protein